MKRILILGLTILILFSFPFMDKAWAAEDTVKALADAAATAQTSGDTAFMLLSAALVLLMTPGLAFFYGGFVRSRNILNTLMMSFLLMALVGVTWVLWSYSFAFAPGLSFFGGLQWLFGNIGLDSNGYLPRMAYEAGLPDDKVLTSYAATIPHQTFMIYQCMFAVITPALISGAIVERLRFKAYFWFVLLWSTIVYNSLAHMVWAKGGFLGLYGGLGALDFAGGTVVHISSGISALVAAWVIGPRRTELYQPSPPHNVPFILLGAGLLWFGWFGFNAGSALASGSLATVAFVATNSATAAAALTWIVLEWVLRGKPTAVGFATGAVAGLVGITPAAGFVTPIGALLIGSITAFICFLAVNFKARIHFDDTLDVCSIHGVGGTMGAILTGVFATKAVNPVGANGLLFGNPSQVLIQLTAVMVAYGVAAVGTFVILKVLALFMTLRVKTQLEIEGVDLSEHGEVGYGEDLAGEISLSS